MRRLAAVSISSLLACSLLACPGRGAESERPDGGTATTQTSRPADFGPWTATLAADHPLVGTAWSTAEQRKLTRAELEQRVSDARFVLLGETHDHPDHHRLQGELIASLIAGEGRGPVVAYEMLDPDRQADIDAFADTGEQAIDAFAKLVDWEHSGWPEWALYRPAFAPVIEAKLPILAAQFTRNQSKQFMTTGFAMLDPTTVERYGLAQPLAPELQALWLDEMFASHCDMVPREQLGGMVEIQRIRDAVMADAMLHGTEQRDQVVLVAGTGHTRAVAVPRLLQMTGVPKAQIVSVGFVAVDGERLEASDYGDEHDILVFTPDIEREDPCAAMRAAAG
jgi:uncharacterized iron-regulated protein